MLSFKSFVSARRMLTLLGTVNFTTYLFSRGKLPMDMNMLVFFLGKMCSDRRKNHGCGLSQKALAVLYLTLGPLPNATNLSVVPAEFAAEPRTKMKCLKANLVT